jgi:hypothetical protein
MAIQQLSQIVASAADPQRVQHAVSFMEYLLRRVPLDMGESRSSRSRGFRIWYEDLLGMYYRIDEAAMRVEILFVGLARRH